MLGASVVGKNRHVHPAIVRCVGSTHVAPGCLFNEQHSAGVPDSSERMVISHPQVPPATRKVIEEKITTNEAKDMGGSCVLVRHRCGLPP